MYGVEIGGNFNIYPVLILEDGVDLNKSLILWTVDELQLLEDTTNIFVEQLFHPFSFDGHLEVVDAYVAANGEERKILHRMHVGMLKRELKNAEGFKMHGDRHSLPEDLAVSRHLCLNVVFEHWFDILLDEDEESSQFAEQVSILIEFVELEPSLGVFH